MKKPNFMRKLRLPRVNMIVGKKQIIVAGLTLLLGAAIYVNYIYSSATRGDNLSPAYESVQKDEPSGSYYGDTAFVSNEAQSGGQSSSTRPSLSSNDGNISDEVRAYFAQARLDMQESRDEAKEFLQAMYQGGDARSDELEVIARDADKLKGYIESETKIENLLKAQGFDDALCYLSDKGANIIVKTTGLDAAGAAKIKNTLLSEVSVPTENITIVEIN